MRVHHSLLTIALISIWPLSVRGDGMVYQLPPDGSWARFSLRGELLSADEEQAEPVLNITGTLTISSVGTKREGGEVCRWLEIVIDGQSNGKVFKEIDRLLIPEQQLGKGKTPLEHLREAWYMHSMMNGGAPRQLKQEEIADLAYVQRIRSILHAPFTKVVSQSDAVVECKLGKVSCACVVADERESQPGGQIEYASRYMIHLHSEAPFGVAAWQATNRVFRKGELLGATRLAMTLDDFGQGAESMLALAD